MSDDPRTRLLAPVSRWYPERKYDLVLGLRGGIVTLDEVLAAHERLTAADIADWEAKVSRGGIRALRVTVRERAA